MKNHERSKIFRRQSENPTRIHLLEQTLFTVTENLSRSSDGPETDVTFGSYWFI